MIRPREKTVRDGQTNIIRTNYTTQSSAQVEPVDEWGRRSSRITVSQERSLNIFEGASEAEMALTKLQIPLGGIPLAQIRLAKQEGTDSASTLTNTLLTNAKVGYTNVQIVPPIVVNGELGPDYIVTSGPLQEPVGQPVYMHNSGGAVSADSQYGYFYTTQELAQFFASIIKQVLLQFAITAFAQYIPDRAKAEILSSLVDVSCEFTADSVVLEIFFSGIVQSNGEPAMNGIAVPILVFGPTSTQPRRTTVGMDTQLVRGNQHIIINTADGTMATPVSVSQQYSLAASEEIRQLFPFLKWVLWRSENPDPSWGGRPIYIWDSTGVQAEFIQGAFTSEWGGDNNVHGKIRVTINSANAINSSCFSGILVRSLMVPLAPQFFPLYQRDQKSRQELSITTSPIFEFYIPITQKPSDLDGLLVVSKENVNVVGPVPVDAKAMSLLRNYSFDFFWLDMWGEMHELRIPSHQCIIMQISWFIKY